MLCCMVERTQQVQDMMMLMLHLMLPILFPSRAPMMSSIASPAALETYQHQPPAIADPDVKVTTYFPDIAHLWMLSIPHNMPCILAGQVGQPASQPLLPPAATQVMLADTLPNLLSPTK